MNQNTMTKPAAKGPKPQTCETECMSAVEFFSAKLQCEMTPWTLKGMMDKKMMTQYCVIDCRTQEAFDECHIPGAMCMPMADLAAKMNNLPKDKTLVCYCGDMTCGLAPKACLMLAQNGFKVMELCGGIATWMEKGFPTEGKKKA